MKLSNIHSSKILTKELLIFDFDGTIIDSSPIHSRAYNLALSDYGFQINYHELKGLSTRDSLLKIFQENNKEMSENLLLKLTTLKQAYAQNFFQESITTINGFTECFKLLSNKKLCIASSASKNSIKTGLKMISLDRAFDLVLSNESIENAKPNPEIFLKALDFFNISSEDALIFEDSMAGFNAAHKANIDYIDINEFTWTQLAEIFKKTI